MDVVSQALGNAGSVAVVTAIGTVSLLLLREMLIWVIAVWAMHTAKEKKEELALMFLCLLASRRAEKMRERLASVKAQIPRARKPSKKELEMEAVSPERTPRT